MACVRRIAKLAAVTFCVAAMASDASYRASVEKWRAAEEAELKAADGWLTVAGLFWLKEGANAVGSDASNAIVLPRGPARAGVFEFHGGKTTFRAAAAAKTQVNGKPAGAAQALKADTEGTPDRVEIQGMTLLVIQRGSRYGVRLKDPESELRKAFSALRWFPVNESLRVKAKFIAYPAAKTIAIPNVLGDTEQEPSPGYVEFSLEGRKLRLDPVVEDGQLFFIFRDQTSGKETYHAGRFLYTDLPKNGEVDLDFNKAQNPPCAFTPYATCPLPPPQNRLAARIEAGEKSYESK